MVARSDSELLVMTRELDAPRALVFDAWTRPQHLARWWRTLWLERPERGAQPGDAFAFGAVRIVVRELAWPERLVFTWGGDDAATATIVTVTFVEQAGKTRLALQQVVGDR